MTGDQIETEIFIGPNYYMRLKHMVKDKINYRALGPRTALTKQPVSGRANDGGLRIGEMERDSIIGHGINDFLRESMMERGDKYQMVVCNTTGTLAVYNKACDLFMSPMADGPLRFFKSESGKGYALDTMTKYGRRFSIVSVPYSLKLLMQELAAINIQLRVITEDNLHQIESMAYSGHLNKLTLKDDMTPEKFVAEMRKALATGEKPLSTPETPDTPKYPEKEDNSSANREFEYAQRRRREAELLEDELAYADGMSPQYQNTSPQYPNVSPAYEPPDYETPEYSESSPVYVPSSQLGSKDSDSKDSEPGYNPNSYGGGPTDGVYGVNDFELGENIYYRGSVDLGLPYNQAWSVAKKGGMLLTIKTNRDLMTGGGTNLTNSDLVQIIKPQAAIKPAEFEKWETQRAGMRQLAERQQMQAVAVMSGGGGGPTQPAFGMGQMPGMTFAPTIKLVGGNDYSKNESAVENAAADGQDSAFSSLVIPKQGGGGGALEREEKQTPKQTAGKEKTIMGGLADFGQLVINKLT